MTTWLIIKWDPDKEDTEGNSNEIRLLDCPYRQPLSLPAI